MLKDIVNITDQLKQASRELEFRAEVLSDEVWDENQDHRNDKPYKNRGSHLLSVSRQGKWLRLAWVKVTYIKTKQGWKQFLNRLPVMLGGASGFKQKQVCLKAATGWEKEMFNAAEDKLECIRQGEEELKKIDRAVQKYIRVMSKVYGKEEADKARNNLDEIYADWKGSKTLSNKELRSDA